MSNKANVEKIGLVLSGGLARGACQLAFANEVIKKVGRDRIKILSCSSIGSLNGYAIATDSVDTMLANYCNFDCESTSEFRFFIKNRLFRKVFASLGNKTIDIPFYVSATRLPLFQEYYFYLHRDSPIREVKSLVNIAMAFPLVNGPKRDQAKRSYIDGGAGDNVPIYPLLDQDLDLILALHLYPRFRPSENAILSCQKDGKILLDVDTTLEEPEEHSSFSLSQTDLNEMVEDGAAYGKQFADFVFQDMTKEGIEARSFEWTRSKIDLRRNKTRDGLLRLVEILNLFFSMRYPE
ncbi:MAG: Patatin-like phospholipase [Tenericutes bacterium ADurb.BinA155]|jgi:predicted acylesterase/phospholipase RssA|nr:MAG: Patatin-like phospholipase [Tenericutes bacterium ADurb.BinA155]